MGRELGIDFLPINDDLERSTASWSQSERLDIPFEGQKFLRQTDGFRLIVSNRAVLNDNLYAHTQPPYNIYITSLTNLSLQAPMRRALPSAYSPGDPHLTSRAA